MPRANPDSSVRVSAFGVPPRHNKNLMWKHAPGSGTDCERGALLLMDFKLLATDELQHSNIEILSIPTILPRVSASIPPTRWENPESDTTQEQGKLSLSNRPRTVSVSFDDAPMSPLPFSPTNSYDSSSTNTLGSPASVTQEPAVEVTPDTRKTVFELPANLKEAGVLLGRSNSSKLVGTEVIGPVKAVLQRKFSWKTYPEVSNVRFLSRQPVFLGRGRPRNAFLPSLLSHPSALTLSILVSIVHTY